VRNLDGEKALKLHLLSEVRRQLREDTDRLVEEHGWTEETATGARRGVSPSYPLDALLCWFFAKHSDEQRDAIYHEGRAIEAAHRQHERPVGFGSHDIAAGQPTYGEVRKGGGNKGRRGA
jgi:hypothetical protein